jgi:hypothetical protein
VWKRVRDNDPEQAKADVRTLLAPIVREQKRYRRSADVQEIERIVPAWRRLLGRPVLAAVPLDDRLWVLREGGRFFLDRYHARGEDEDLQLAVAIAERALADVPAGSHALPQHLSDLGITLRARFLRWGEQRDIVKYLNNLGICLLSAPDSAPAPAPSPRSTGCSGAPARRAWTATQARH